MPECGAKTRSGKPCTVAAMPNGRCYRHGGSTPSGVASANFRHGAHSKHLPERMAAEYAQGRKNADALSVSDDIALLFARQCDVLDRVDTGESGEMWRSLLASIKEAQRCRREFNKAMACEDFSGLREAGKDLNDALDAMELLAQGGVSDYAAWREVKDLSERLRKLRESETKRLVAMQEMVTKERAQAMLGQVLFVLRTHIQDRNKLGDVSAELRRVVALATGG